MKNSELMVGKTCFWGKRLLFFQYLFPLGKKVLSGVDKGNRGVLLLVEMRDTGDGFSIIEVLVVLLIFSLLMVPATVYFLRYQRDCLLDSAAKEVIAIADFARESAVNERKMFSVVLDDEGFAVLREGSEQVDKKHRFPEHIEIKEKSAGFSPLVFNPDGTAKTGGFLVLRNRAGNKEVKIMAHNLTGRCFIADDEKADDENTDEGKKGAEK